MLEALHLTKVYKTKGGADVRALDDVSIQFPERGMVFLLGKSGSGKSTLLNVCGGLDSPTSGEIIVKGRSSKTFSQSDFDSYRNTFVGFIFQEYNILNEFTVEDNIAIALELQGKPKDKKVIADLLEQVDLTGYAKRKPNTLSGGQKQRIAIARALVKSPEIIMADEPTGALDSATGKQVFDTLKKLSKDKLVIVVSHDRDFAEAYGDRIIELKDGKVLSDVTKTQEESQDLSSNISVVGDTLCVKKGTLLTEEDFAEIKKFLSKAENDVIIAGGQREVKNFKKANHINEDGGMEVFRDSEEIPVEPKNYLLQDSRFIRSKLPARHAFKIGVSGMKTKPIRLFFTILLCTVAFIFFGLLSTMTFYDSEATFKQSLKESNYTLVQMGKVYKMQEILYYDGEKDWDYTYPVTTSFTKAELEEYKKTFGEDVFGGVSVWWDYNVQSSAAQYWFNEISNIAYIDENNGLRGKITGAYPQKENEICISSYMADLIYNCKIYDNKTGELLELKEPADIIGKKLILDGTTYTVVGIVDSGEISEKYEELKNPENRNSTLRSGLRCELNDGLHLVAFVSEEKFEQIAEMYSYGYETDDLYFRSLVATLGWGTGGTYSFPEWGNGAYIAFSKNATPEDFISLMDGKTAPADNEVVISTAQFYSLIMELADKDMKSEDAMVQENAAKMYELAAKLSLGGVEYQDSQTGEWNFRVYTDAEKQQYLDELLSMVKASGKTLTLAIRLFDNDQSTAFGDVKEYTVIGLLGGKNGEREKLLFSDATVENLWNAQKQNLNYYYEYFTSYVKPQDAIYETLFLPYNHSEEQTAQLWSIYENQEYDKKDTRSVLTSDLISNLEMVDMMVAALEKGFLYAGLVLAVFAALLLSNFISVSISYKKREIGILRAVGARSFDVFKIFFSESFVITAICIVLSLVGSLVCCALIDGALVSLIGASLFVFGPLSLLVLLAVALVTAVVATFLPVWNAAKKKPVESIRSL